MILPKKGSKGIKVPRSSTILPKKKIRVRILSQKIRQRGQRKSVSREIKDPNLVK
jgi:hypothetical protein